MVFPTKHTHTLTVDGIGFRWYRSAKWETHSRWTGIRQAGGGGQLLLLDPYQHDLSPGAGGVRLAIEFALAHGWTPARPIAPMKLRYNGDGAAGTSFTILPADAQPGRP